jgi:hypothetical protein
MSSVLKVDQIQSDTGTVNVASNLQFSSGFTMLTPTLSSPTLTTPTTSGVMTLGAGIKFPATQVSDADGNTLDDYEEGTWTPFIYGGTTAGTYTYEADRTGGRYVKMGRTVWFYGGVRIATRPSPGSGDLNIGGLPFTSGGAFSSAGWTGNMTMCYSLSTVSGVHIVGRINDGDTNINCFDIADFNYGTNVPSIGTYDGVNFWLIFEGRYTTNS